ncbi:TolC family protein [Leptospira ryugenii]|nr:TolC family protein [Leptospira ryugenii]
MVLFLWLLSPSVLFADSQDALEIGLLEAEGIALSNSVILASLKDRREVFRMIASEKWRNYLPRVSLSYFGLKNANLNQSDSQYNDIRFQLNQLLYDGGETALEIESATLQELLNQEDWKLSRDRLLLEMRKTYAKFLASDTKLFVTKRTKERMERLWFEMKKEREHGFLNELQIIETKTKLRDLELNCLKADSAKKQWEIELKKLMQFPPDTKIRWKESLHKDFFFSPIKSMDNVQLTEKAEYKKARLAVETTRIKKEIAENDWKPKLYLGGYYGENTNGPLPVKNEVYGFQFTLQTKFGSTTNQSSSHYGVQTDGTGIQRIPGFGPQFVGRGDNAFNSSTFQLFDDLSFSRKIYEGKIAHSDAIRNHRMTEANLLAELEKAKQKSKESWEMISMANTRFEWTLELWKSYRKKVELGFLKESELLGAELEVLKALEELTSALSTYMESGAEYAFALGLPLEEIQAFQIKKGEGNSYLKHWLDSDEVAYAPSPK